MSEKLRKYIESVSVCDDKSKNLNILKELSELLVYEEYDDKFMLCMNLLSRYENINSIVQSVVNDNLELIKNGKFSSIYSNVYFNNFIDIYCMNNNIDISINSSIYPDLSYSEDYYIKSIKNIPILSREEELQLFNLYNSSDPIIRKNAWKKLIESNLRLVVSIAFKYRNRYVPFEDIISEGNMGLMKAIEKFDASLGNRLSTYAGKSIGQSISRHIYSRSRLIKLPTGFIKKMMIYDRFIKEWEEEYGSIPSLENIMVGTGFSSDDIIYIQQHSNGVVSLETPVGEEEDSSLIDFVADSSSSVEDSYDNRNFMSSLYDIFDKLNFDQRDIDIIVMRLGLDGNGERTLEEIGSKYNITRERVRQKVVKSLIKIRNYIRRSNLVEELGLKK